MASHRSLSCLLTVKLFIGRGTTGVNNNSPVHYDRKCKDDRIFISHRRFSSSRSFCWEGRGKSISDDMIQLPTALILIRLFQRAVKFGSTPRKNECKGTNVSIDNFDCALYI